MTLPAVPTPLGQMAHVSIKSLDLFTEQALKIEGTPEIKTLLGQMAHATRTSVQLLVEKATQTECRANTHGARVVVLERQLRAMEDKINALGVRKHTMQDRGDLIAEIRAMIAAVLPHQEGNHG